MKKLVIVSLIGLISFSSNAKLHLSFEDVSEQFVSSVKEEKLDNPDWGNTEFKTIKICSQLELNTCTEQSLDEIFESGLYSSIGVSNICGKEDCVVFITRH